MFNKVFLEPPPHLTFQVADAHQFTPAEVAELHDHFYLLARTQWGVSDPAMWNRLWPLSAVGSIPSVARFPSVLMDPDVRFAPGEEPNLKPYHESVQSAYKRIRDTYTRIPEMACGVCFTAPAADWWPYAELYPVVITADNPTTLLHAVYLSVGLVNEEARADYARPRGQRTSTSRNPERSARYTAWLAACADHRERLAAARAEYEAAFEGAERARRAWRDLQAQGAPRWEP